MRAGLDESVAALSRRAQTALGVGKGHLVDWPGSILDVRAPIQKANLQNGGLLDIARTPSSSSSL